MMRLLFSIFIFSYFLLSACTMNSHFDCPNKAGVNCHSLDEINRMVDQGTVLESRAQSTLAPTNVTIDHTFESYTPMTPESMATPIRYAETVERIWIAPFTDTDGNYHDASLIYTIVKGGSWINDPVHEME